MAKILEDKYPIGSFKNQRTAGRYMEQYLIDNLDVMALKIADDLQFLGLISSSTYEVRSGKSTLAQQVGEYYTWKVNKLHNTNITFDEKNIVFNSTDLMNRAMELPKYSCLILDENDELDEHYFSNLAKDLRRFFRKSGQLNLFIILIVPNFFQLKSNYAISRSNFLIDVRFGEGFERGHYSFYNYEKKKDLYLLGKKTMNFSVVSPNFTGVFLDGYAIDRAKYLEAKKKDLLDKEKITNSKVTKQQNRAYKAIVKLYYEENWTASEIAELYGLKERWIHELIKQNSDNSLENRGKMQELVAQI